jgi:uncharacterized membrane protein YkvA (DUF1232 family)
MRKKSLTRLWSRLPSRVWRILRAPQVAVSDKLLFIIPVLLYWVLPDFMPFLPIDDIAVTVLAAGWFAGKMERKYSLENARGNQYNRTRP